MASGNTSSHDEAVDTALQPRRENGSMRPRRLFIIRHGERCDFTFGSSWLHRCFDEEGTYRPFDENLPSMMISRDSYKEFRQDCPLTENGCSHAHAVGEAFHRAGVHFQHVYSSPALRCIETAQNVLNGMKSKVKICIEPTAFEFFGWFADDMPKWLPPHRLADCGFSIDVNHRPLVEVKNLQIEETFHQYYNRCYELATHLLKKHEDEGGDILIVSHGLNLDTFTRYLVGKPPRSPEEIHKILPTFSYCAVCCVVQGELTKAWSLAEPPIPRQNEFDWRILL